MNGESDREQLIHSYVAETITAAEMEKLNAILEKDESARQELMEWLNLDSALAELAAGWEATRESSQKVVSMGTTRYKQLLSVAACLALLLVSFLWITSSDGDAFAVVEKTVGTREFSEGLELGDAPYRLEVGVIELHTARGARVVIEAPAEFRFLGPQKLDLIRGRLAADVPDTAKGFTVVTPDGDAVDLGTRFGVDVPEVGTSEIHVFEGEVIAKGGGEESEGKSLRGGEALELREAEGVSRELRSAAFIHPDEIRALDAGLAAGQQERSANSLDRWRSDPALIELIDFESYEPEGEFRMVQGRWPGSRAPEFVQVDDRMELNVGEGREFPQLTLAAWVRLDRLGAPYQSLLHTDGWSESNPGQVHWMITGNTTMRLALRGNTLAAGAEESAGYPDSSIPVLPEKGRWIHLVTVYDSKERTVRFFLNGKFDKETRQEVSHPARLGPLQIGNWDMRDRKLSGRIDELLLLGRTLSDEEVRELYETGSPYR